MTTSKGKLIAAHFDFKCFCEINCIITKNSFPSTQWTRSYNEDRHGFIYWKHFQLIQVNKVKLLLKEMEST